jgi:hypothetical protein
VNPLHGIRNTDHFSIPQAKIVIEEEAAAWYHLEATFTTRRAFPLYVSRLTSLPLQSCPNENGIPKRNKMNRQPDERIAQRKLSFLEGGSPTHLDGEFVYGGLRHGLGRSHLGSRGLRLASPASHPGKRERESPLESFSLLIDLIFFSGPPLVLFLPLSESPRGRRRTREARVAG